MADDGRKHRAKRLRHAGLLLCFAHGLVRASICVAAHTRDEEGYLVRVLACSNIADRARLGG